MPQPGMSSQVTAAEVLELCGDLLDWKIAAIFDLGPTADDVAAAVAWAGGQDDLGQEGRPLEAMAAQVFDVLMADDFPDDERRA